MKFHRSQISRYPPGYFTWEGTFDFFHYSGILRPANLLFRPTTFVDDFQINAGADGTNLRCLARIDRCSGAFNYSFVLNGNEADKLDVVVRIRDPKGRQS